MATMAQELEVRQRKPESWMATMAQVLKVRQRKPESWMATDAQVLDAVRCRIEPLSKVRTLTES